DSSRVRKARARERSTAGARCSGNLRRCWSAGGKRRRDPRRIFSSTPITIILITIHFGKHFGDPMNIILWILQVLVAFLCGSGALWRVANYAKDAQDIASVRALS